MARRFPVAVLAVGVVHLDVAESHHARGVMRLGVGDRVALFDSTGCTATGPIVQVEPTVGVQVAVVTPPPARPQLVVASAVPKGNRADWMIEKLAEIGVTRFIPLQTARSVVHPEGAGKLDRWERLASEAAKQSHRAGNLELSPLTSLPTLLREIQSQAAARWFLTTQPPAEHFAAVVQTLKADRSVYLAIGPEGGWTDQEEEAFRAAAFAAVVLTPSVLRIETAALVAAGAVASWLNGRS